VLPVFVHNQCSDFELISPEYFGHDKIQHILPDQKVNINAITRAAFRKELVRHDFTTALLYKLRRRSYNPNNPSDADNIRDTSTSIQLLVIWRVDNNYKFYVNAMLIKHNNIITWDDNKLKKVYSMHHTLQTYEHTIEDTWLLDDATVLMTTLKWGRTVRAIEITIAERAKEDYSMESLCIPSTM
jgi:hypothetical protein